MTQFNINNSKIEQLNNSGNNYKSVNEQPLDSENSRRIFIEDIDNFSKVRTVTPGIVAPLLNNGYLDMSEDSVQSAIEQILAVSFHKKDWAGEWNDLYTANVVVQGVRTPAAFLLKGNGLKTPFPYPQD